MLSSLKKWLFPVILIGAGSALTLGAGLLINTYCDQQIPELRRFHTDPVISLSQVDPSYLLLTPIVPNHPNEPAPGGSIYLTDLYGKTIHQWYVQYIPFYSIIKPNGNILVLEDRKNSPAGPFAYDPIIEELSWNNTVVWSYANMGLHHDLTLLPNGNIASLVTTSLTPEQTNLVAGGMPATGAAALRPMTSEEIIEVDHQGNIVWKWDAVDHLNPTQFPLESIDLRTEWLHANSLNYVAHNPIDGEEAYLVSFRQISTVMLIRKKDGAVIWTSPHFLFDHQHDATMLSNGHILVFDNSGYNRNRDQQYLGTRVIEIDPRTNQVVWSWTNGDTPYEQAQFETSLIGGAQQLPNGDTMIVDGIRGHLFEITPNKNLVWDFTNPYAGNPATGLWLHNSIFKARRISPAELHPPTPLPPPLPVTTAQCHTLNNTWAQLVHRFTH